MICSHLSGPVDQVTGSHRSHGLALALGVDPVAVAAEIMGREAGLSSGLGGTQHLLAPEAGFLSSNGIVGGQVPLAAGAALAAKVRQTGGVAAAFMGDGATNQGAVFETLNLAMALRLPLLFVVENNGLGQSTSASYASGGANIAARARGFGLAASTVDGCDIAALQNSADRMVNWVRSSGTPAFLEVVSPRLDGHYHGENQVYRMVSDKMNDPLQSFENYLLHQDIPEARIKSVMIRAKEEAVTAVKKGVATPDTSDQALTAWLSRMEVIQ